MKTILAPIDFSPVTSAVIAQAAALTRAFDARLVLFYAMPVLTDVDLIGMCSYGAELGASERETRARLAERESQLAAEGIPVEARFVIGQPVMRILDQAKEAPADYIVMGSHGHSALYDLLVGSTTHGVLSGAACPVVIVRATSGMADRDAAKEQAATGIARA